jgi:nitrate reductase NapE component
MDTSSNTLLVKDEFHHRNKRKTKEKFAFFSHSIFPVVEVLGAVLGAGGCCD